MAVDSTIQKISEDLWNVFVTDSTRFRMFTLRNADGEAAREEAINNFVTATQWSTDQNNQSIFRAILELQRQIVQLSGNAKVK